MSVCRVACASESVSPRHAEIENLRLARFVHQDVAGLQVAMDEPALMRVLHRVADLGHQLQPLPRVEPMRVGNMPPATAPASTPWRNTAAVRNRCPAVPAS